MTVEELETRLNEITDHWDCPECGRTPMMLCPMIEAKNGYFVPGPGHEPERVSRYPEEVHKIEKELLEIIMSSEDGMVKYGVTLDDQKEKTASKNKNEIRICPVCAEELDDAGACPEHGTKPLEPDSR